MFDWRALNRWGLSERNLPPGSIVLYRERNALGRYKWLVIASLVVASLLVLLTGYLLIERGRRRQAEMELARGAKFQKLIAELSNIFYRSPSRQNRYGDRLRA
jgi:hypothetical protein